MIRHSRQFDQEIAREDRTEQRYRPQLHPEIGELFPLPCGPLPADPIHISPYRSRELWDEMTEGWELDIPPDPSA